MQLEHTIDQDVYVIKLPKRILMVDSKETRRSLHAFLASRRPRLALDMNGVEFIDSSGLAVLVNCLQTSRRKSGDVCLFGMSETVKALFELTRLHSVFPIAEGRQDAITRLAA